MLIPELIAVVGGGEGILTDQVGVMWKAGHPMSPSGTMWIEKAVEVIVQRKIKMLSTLEKKKKKKKRYGCQTKTCDIYFSL